MAERNKWCTMLTMKKGLVLEGGAMRGLFTAGVLDVLMINDIIFDGAIGVSAGAAFGCNIKSKQIGRVLRYNMAYCRDKRHASIASLLLTGDLFGTKFNYDILPHQLDIWDSEAFAKNPMEFYCVATDCKTGKAVYHKCTDGLQNDLLWIQGSASMPMVSKPVQVDGYELLDGGISDSIPLDYFTSIGYDRNVVVLTQPLGYQKQPYSGNMEKLLKFSLLKMPAVYDALMQRHEMYNACIASILEKEKKGEILVIRPPEPLNISSVCREPDEYRRVYNLGKNTALQQLEALKNFLGTSK